jgi:hypothetical protein
MQAGRTVAPNRAEAFPLGSSSGAGIHEAGSCTLSTDGAEHERHRGPFARPFRLDAVRRLDPERPSVVSGLVFRKPHTLHVVWG